MSKLTLTLEQLKELKPCHEGFTWYSRNVNTESVPEILEQLSSHRWDWCRWLFVRLLNENQNRRLAIYCAEIVLPIFESKYPDDKRPREAIEAAKKYLKGEICLDDLTVKRYAAAGAAAYAAYAAYAAAYTAYSYSYAYDAADYAYTADAADADAADAASIKQKIIEKVIALLKDGEI